MNRSDILSYSHKQSKILGGHRFPSILKKLWSVSKDYKGTVSTRNVLLSLPSGNISSIELMGELKKLGVDIVYSHALKEYVVGSIDFSLPNYSNGSVFLSPSSILKLRADLYRKHSIEAGLTMEKTDVIMFILKHDKGFEFLSDNSISTSSGKIISSEKGYTDLYYFPEAKREEFIQHCKESYSGELSSTERSIQATLVGLWNILKNSTTSSIEVDYEVGVRSGEKRVSLDESRYDLVIRENNKTSLVELKRGDIDIATLHYKISIMDMGSDVNTIHPGTAKTLVFIGNRVDPKVIRFISNSGSSRLKVYTYKKYLNYLQSKISQLGLHSLDNEMAQYFLNTFKNLIYEQK